MRYKVKSHYQSMTTFEKEFGIKFTKEHTGKMLGMISLSTSPIDNTFCKARRKCKSSICSHCYSYNMNNMFPPLRRMLKNNLKRLTEREIPVEKMPILNVLYFRLESFGDIENETQLVNYFNLCHRNPAVNFTIWTKNLPVFKRVLESGHNKPKNLTIVSSSHFVNTVTNVDAYPFVDKVFTVYEKKFAERNGIKINCGGRSCMTCLRCYERGNAERFVNELLK